MPQEKKMKPEIKAAAISVVAKKDATATSTTKPNMSDLRLLSSAKEEDNVVEISKKINKITGDISKLKGRSQSLGKQPNKIELNEMIGTKNQLEGELKSKLNGNLPSKMSGYYQEPWVREHYKKYGKR